LVVTLYTMAISGMRAGELAGLRSSVDFTRRLTLSRPATMALPKRSTWCSSKPTRRAFDTVCVPTPDGLLLGSRRGG